MKKTKPLSDTKQSDSKQSKDKQPKDKQPNNKTLLDWSLLRLQSWLPGGIAISLVLVARALGLFQTAELKVFDRFMQLRPAEPTDERILIVGINESDIQQTGTYPIPDRQLAELLQALQRHDPRAIGLDIIRDLPVNPGYEIFKTTLAQSNNIVGIERISTDIVVPHTLPPERSGFIDLPLDSDGFVRRTYLGAFPPLGSPDPDRFRYAFAFLLAERYLEAEGLFLEAGDRDPYNMRFGNAEFFSLKPYSGGYVRNDADGIQMLINVRSGSTPFEIVSMNDVVSGQVGAASIQNRVVLIGIVSLSVKDVINSGAVNTDNPGLVNGVEMHAHIVSQLLSTVLDGRRTLSSLPEGAEYLLIAIAGLLGMGLARASARPVVYTVVLVLLEGVLVVVALLLLWAGWWLPVVPVLIVFSINAAIVPAFYLYDRALRSQIEERQRVIEQSYDDIHGGPLQTLALLLRKRDTLGDRTTQQLEVLNRELRQIYERLLDQSAPQAARLVIGENDIVDISNPLHEVLYEVYTLTLKKDFPAFDTIRLKLVKFEPFQAAKLRMEDRRALCRFLEESLCNVGKYAPNSDHLMVNCLATSQENLIQVENKTPTEAKAFSPLSPRSAQRSAGRGTQQAKSLAARLHGTFRRYSTETGTVCELRWPLSRSRHWWLP